MVLGLTVVVLLLIQPHAMYYDMALLLFTYMLYVSHDRRTAKAVGLMWLLSFSQAAARIVGFSPLFLLLLWSGLMAIRCMRRQADKRVGRRFLGISA